MRDHRLAFRAVAPLSLRLLPLLLFSGFNLFWNLDHVAFWDDEAQTAIFARNLLSQGKITGWDGKNLYAYRNGSILNGEFLSIQPPLDVLVTALSFRLFGESEKTARLPFALSAFLALFVFIWIVRKDAHAEWSVLYFGLSTQFLLNGRQCRYYSLCLFLGLVFFAVWDEFIRRKSWWGVVGAVSSAALLYYANYLVASAWIAVVVGASLYLSSVRVDRKFVSWCLGVLALTLPHAIYFSVWNRHDISYDDTWLVRHAGHLWTYSRDLIYYVPTLVLILLVVRYRRSSPWRWFTLFYGNAVVVSLFSPQPGGAVFSDFRFLILSLPMGSVLVGHFIVVFKSAATRWAVLALLTTTNLFSLGYSRQKPMWTLPNLVLSVCVPYETSIAAVSSYLKDQMKESETFLAVPDHFNYPIYYYTGHQACCTLDDRSRLKTANGLPAPLKFENHTPDWIVAFGESHAEVIEKFKGRAEYIRVTRVPVYFDQTQRPEPFDHKYFPVKDFAESKGVFIYRRAPRND